MKIEISYSEIEQYLKKYQGYEVMLSHVSGQTLRVKTKVEYRLLFKHSLDVDANVTLNKIVGADLYLSYSFLSQKMEKTANTAFRFFGSTISRKLPMVEKRDGNNLIVHLFRINKLSAVLRMVELQDVQFNPDSITLYIKSRK